MCHEIFINRKMDFGVPNDRYNSNNIISNFRAPITIEFAQRVSKLKIGKK